LNATAGNGLPAASLAGGVGQVQGPGQPRTGRRRAAARVEPHLAVIPGGHGSEQRELGIPGAGPGDSRRRLFERAALSPRRRGSVRGAARLPVLDGLEATRQILAARRAADGAAPRVLILTTFDLDEYVFGALRAGASGFALKNRPLEELLAAIRVIAAGEALLAPAVTRRLIAHYARQPHAGGASPRSLDQLTVREREVLVLIARGLSNTELAAQLYMSVPTAKTHVSRILAKLGARDRAQLVAIAYESGLVTAG
jgi:DNA-binding NarL/FixJ family response regulator